MNLLELPPFMLYANHITEGLENPRLVFADDIKMLTTENSGTTSRDLDELYQLFLKMGPSIEHKQVPKAGGRRSLSRSPSVDPRIRGRWKNQQVNFLGK